MALIALGVNHQTCPVAVRERLAIGHDELPRALGEIRARGASGAAIVSTCNRTALLVDAPPAAARGLRDWLAGRGGLDPARLDEFLYEHRDADAARHLFRVASGLDSMVLGEPQILGQVKEAYHGARAAGALDPALDRLFQNAFAVAKRVRTETRIGTNPVSVAFAAVRLAERVFADLSGIAALLVGAGDTIELALRHLAESGVRRLTIANRTLKNAESLAARHGARAIGLADLEAALPEADLVITSTASREPIVSRDALERAIRRRRHRPMLVIDLGVPRDVEPAAAELADVYLYAVDDLARVIEDNLRSRREAAREAEAIIDLSVDHFMGWLRAVDGHDALRGFRARAERERDAWVERALGELAAGRDPAETVRRLAHGLTNQLLHVPTANLRAAARAGDHELLRAAERLFEESAPPPDRPR
jgi:glutamyl-tRNA reductase